MGNRLKKMLIDILCGGRGVFKELLSGSLEAFELRTELGISAIFTAALAMTDDCAENTKVPWPRAKICCCSLEKTKCIN